MLSVNLIERHFRSRRFHPLLEGVAANGMELPLPLRVRLSQSPVAAVGLGLRRVLDMTYGPTSLSREMIDYLLEAQQGDGSFEQDPLMTAVAAGALSHLHTLPRPVEDERLEPARLRALAALGQMQSEDGLFVYRDDRTEQDRALVASFILFLLGSDDDFPAAVRVADLLNWFDQNADALDRETARLWNMAQAGSSVLAAALAA